MPKTSIFTRLGGTYYVPIATKGAVAYVTFAGKNSAAGDMLSTLLEGRAPATKIRVTQAVDNSLTKSFAGDFLFMTFGYNPVSITISGLDIFHSTCITKAGQSLTGTVQSFFDDYNVYENPDARIVMGMSSGHGNKSAAFQCILTGMERSKAGGTAGQGNIHVGDYTMQLIGVKI